MTMEKFEPGILPLIARNLDKTDHFIERIRAGGCHAGGVEEQLAIVSSHPFIQGKVDEALNNLGTDAVSAGIRPLSHYLSSYAAPEIHDDYLEPAKYDVETVANQACATRHWLSETFDKLNQLLRTIVYVAAQPQPLRTIDWGEEIRRIQGAIRSGTVKNLDLELCTAAQLNDLHYAVSRYLPEALHFSGHAVPEGIYLRDARGNPFLLAMEHICGIIEAGHAHLQCVVLNARYTDAAAAHIAGHAPLVIGTSAEIHDSTSIRFSESFYQHVALGYDYRASYAAARRFLLAARDPCATMLTCHPPLTDEV